MIPTTSQHETAAILTKDQWHSTNLMWRWTWKNEWKWKDQFCEFWWILYHCHVVTMIACRQGYHFIEQMCVPGFSGKYKRKKIWSRNLLDLYLKSGFCWKRLPKQTTQTMYLNGLKIQATHTVYPRPNRLKTQATQTDYPNKLPKQITQTD